MLRPSGVSSAREASWAALASSSTVTPGAGRKAVAWRSPRVIVPVLSRSRTSTSPAASTARPLMARTFFWTMRSMPAMPMAFSRPPIVVGIRQTRRATRTVVVKVTPEYAPKGFKVMMTTRKMIVRAERRMVRAISFGVFWRRAPSTRPIIRSRKLFPGSAVTRTLMLVGQDAGAAGDRAPVAARLADDRGGLAGDGGFVHRGRALDDLTVGRE